MHHRLAGGGSNLSRKLLFAFPRCITCDDGRAGGGEKVSPVTEEPARTGGEGEAPQRLRDVFV